MSKVYTKTN